MKQIITLNEEMLSSMPLKECGSLFCLNSGPSTPSQILCEGPIPNLIVGFCAVCRRYVCGQCSVFRVVAQSGREYSEVGCRYCGLSLGAEPGSLLVSRRLAEGLREVEERSAALDQSELPDSEWAELYRDAVRRGVIKTIGMLKLEAALTTERSKRLLTLLEEEELLCRRANYEAGLAQCATKKSAALVALGRFKRALDCTEQGTALWQRLGNRKMLARSFFGRYFLLFGEHFLNRPDQQTPETKLAQLQEMWDAARGIEPRIVELAIAERTKIHLARADLVSFIADLSQASEGIRKIEDQVTLWAANKEGCAAKPRARTTEIDDSLIRRMRASNEVWGCPNGCRPAGTLGIVGIPRGQRIANFPCLVCGVSYICLNNYSRITASVPDWPEPSTLKRREFADSARQGIAIANFSLLMRDDGRAEAAVKLQGMAVSVWGQDLGTNTEAFAKCLDGLAGELLIRDEHEASRDLCQRGLLIAETLDPSMPGLLASLLTKLGLSLVCLGEYDRAEWVLRQALEMSPVLANAHYWLAKLYFFRAGPDDQALEALAWRYYLSSKIVAVPRRREAEARLAVLESREYPSSEPTAPDESPLKSPEHLRWMADSLRGKGDDEALLACLADLFDEVRKTDSSARGDIAIEMERVSRRLNTAPAILSALSRRAEVLMDRGDNASLPVLAECETLSRQLGDGPALAACLYAQGQLHEKQGRLEQGTQRCDEAATLYAELQNVPKALICLRQSIRILEDRKEWASAALRAQATTRLTRSLEDSSELIEALQEEARIKQQMGDGDAELDINEEIAAICRRDGDTLLLIASLCRQSDLLLGLGVDTSPSVDLLTEAFDLCKLQIAKLVAKGVSRDAAEYVTELKRRRIVLHGFDRICRALIKSGQFSLGIAMYDHTIELLGTALASSPEDHALRLDMVAALDELGVTILEFSPGDGERAIQSFRRAMSELQQLNRTHPPVAYGAERSSLRDSVVSHLAEARRRFGWRAAAMAFRGWLGRGSKSQER